MVTPGGALTSCTAEGQFSAAPMAMLGVQGVAAVPLRLANDARTVTDSPANAVRGALAVVCRSTGLITVVPVAEVLAGRSSGTGPEIVAAGRTGGQIGEAHCRIGTAVIQGQGVLQPRGCVCTTVRKSQAPLHPAARLCCSRHKDGRRCIPQERVNPEHAIAGRGC